MTNSLKEIFIKKAITIHGNKYNYDNINYINNSTKIDIFCNTCNETFSQLPCNHVRSKITTGCPKCGILKQAANKVESYKKKFVERAKEIHGDKYDYSLAEYTGSNSLLKIICNTCNEIFEQKPVNHLHKNKPTGCPKCGLDKIRSSILSKKLSKEEFVERAKEIHGDNYDYSLVEFSSLKDKVKIICNTCNEIFEQIAGNHIRKVNPCKCLKCAIQNVTKTNEEFLQQTKEVHGDKYTYLEPYTRNIDKIKILCNKCNNEFVQRPKSHINEKQGCPTCNTPGSLLEEIISKILDKTNIPYERRVRGLLSRPRLELDLYVPSFKLAIECHGNYWHSEIIKDHTKAMNHMKDKFNLCNDKEITLLQFYEDEIRNKPELIESMINYKLNIGNKIYARNTDKFFFKYSDLSKEDIKIIEEFFNKNHIQGICKYNSGVLLLEKNTDNIVSIMLFNNVTSKRGVKASSEEVELVRFCSNRIVIGGASKLFKYYLEMNPLVNKVISYSDNRISQGNLYNTLNFKIDSYVSPSYFYIHEFNNYSLDRYHKSKFKKENQKKMFKDNYDSNLTEYENAKNNDYYRIWDAGKIKWIYIKKQNI